MSSSHMSSDDMHQMIRSEMANVLNEIASAQGHRNTIGASPLDAFAAETASLDRVQLLKERIAVLEDALAKSETDRAATYLKLEHTSRQLQAANEEKLAMMHEYHDAHHGPVAEATMMLTAAQEDNHRLRHQLTLLSERYDAEVPQLRSVVREQQLEIKRLKKGLKASASGRDERVADAVTIADLHYSNERLSAQLAKLQAPAAAPVVDEAKFRDLEESVTLLTDEMSSLEAKMGRMKTHHEAEKRELLRTLDTVQREFEAERAECDKVVEIMASKISSLMEQNTMLQSICEGMGNGGGVDMTSSTAKRTPRR